MNKMRGEQPRLLASLFKAAIMRNRLFLIMLMFLMGAGCAGGVTRPPVSTPVPRPTTDPFFTARDGGEPRGSAYWLLWNSCAPDNRAQTAVANGGREAGWFIMDDLLADPGVLLGEMEIVACADGVRLLQYAARAADTGGDVAYPLAGQLLAAQLNLAVGAAHCEAVDEAVQSAQLLLLAAGFNGTGPALGAGAPTEDRALAQFLTEQLAVYNAGGLCQ